MSDVTTRGVESVHGSARFESPETAPSKSVNINRVMLSAAASGWLIVAQFRVYPWISDVDPEVQVDKYLQSQPTGLSSPGTTTRAQTTRELHHIPIDTYLTDYQITVDAIAVPAQLMRSKFVPIELHTIDRTLIVPPTLWD